jgi:hypothetical protein
MSEEHNIQMWFVLIFKFKDANHILHFSTTGGYYIMRKLAFSLEWSAITDYWILRNFTDKPVAYISKVLIFHPLIKNI